MKTVTTDCLEGFLQAQRKKNNTQLHSEKKKLVIDLRQKRPANAIQMTKFRNDSEDSSGSPAMWSAYLHMLVLGLPQKRPS